MGLSILVVQSGDKRILRLEGRLDDQTAPSLAKELDSCLLMHYRKILLDMTGIEDISEKGMQALLLETNKFKEARGCLGLSNASDPLMKKLMTAGFHRDLLIFSDERTAMKAMSS
jgi:anti-anti-sigma factor